MVRIEIPNQLMIVVAMGCAAMLGVAVYQYRHGGVTALKIAVVLAFFLIVLGLEICAIAKIASEPKSSRLDFGHHHGLRVDDTIIVHGAQDESRNGAYRVSGVVDCMSLEVEGPYPAWTPLPGERGGRLGKMVQLIHGDKAFRVGAKC